MISLRAQNVFAISYSCACFAICLCFGFGPVSAPSSHWLVPQLCSPVLCWYLFVCLRSVSMSHYEVLWVVSCICDCCFLVFVPCSIPRLCYYFWLWITLDYHCLPAFWSPQWTVITIVGLSIIKHKLSTGICDLSYSTGCYRFTNPVTAILLRRVLWYIICIWL